MLYFAAMLAARSPVRLLQRVELSIAVRLFVAGPGGRWIGGGDDYAVWAASAVEPALAWQIQVDGSVLVLRLRC